MKLGGTFAHQRIIGWTIIYRAGEELQPLEYVEASNGPLSNLCRIYSCVVWRYRGRLYITKNFNELCINMDKIKCSEEHVREQHFPMELSSVSVGSYFNLLPGYRSSLQILVAPMIDSSLGIWITSHHSLTYMQNFRLAEGKYAIHRHSAPWSQSGSISVRRNLFSLSFQNLMQWHEAIPQACLNAFRPNNPVGAQDLDLFLHQDQRFFWISGLASFLLYIISSKLSEAARSGKCYCF